MPISLPPISRRRFLAGSLAAGAAAVTAGRLQAAETSADPNLWILTADTHIWRQRDEVVRRIKMADNFEQVQKAVLALQPRPAGLLINGDCAFQTGEAGDYALLGELAKPYLAAGIPLHMTLGNHDHRDRFREGLAAANLPASAVEAKHVTVIETALANWFLIDSLDKTNVTPGVLGTAQLEWLAKALDARPSKPAIVFGHHHPAGKGERGLEDSDDLFEILAPRRQVKAYIFGHTHNWLTGQRAGIHLVNLPPVAYVFREDKPNGWVQARLRGDGLSLMLHTLDAEHPANREQIELAWRE